MAAGGYLAWDSRFLQGAPSLDGVDWTVHGIPLDLSWEEAPDGDLFAIPTASGEHVLQSPIYDPVASELPSRYVFALPLQVNDEEVYFRLKRAKRKAEAVNFVPFLWDEEVFKDLEIADTRSLARPVAWGVAAGVTSVTHPALYYLDDVLDAAAASLSGGPPEQTLTALKAGDVAIRYMPVFKVIVRELSEVIEDVNGLSLNCTLEEVRRYA